MARRPLSEPLISCSYEMHEIRGSDEGLQAETLTSLDSIKFLQYIKTKGFMGIVRSEEDNINWLIL